MNLLIEAQRAEALKTYCAYCHKDIGERCINPRTGEPLEHQAAHLVRINQRALLVRLEQQGVGNA